MASSDINETIGRIISTMYEDGVEISLIAKDTGIDTSLVKANLLTYSSKYRDKLVEEKLAAQQQQQSSAQQTTPINNVCKPQTAEPHFNGDSGKPIKEKSALEIRLQDPEGIPVTSAVSNEEYDLVMRGLVQLALTSPDESIRVRASKIVVEDKRNRYNGTVGKQDGMSNLLSLGKNVNIVMGNVIAINEAIKRGSSGALKPQNGEPIAIDV